MFGVDNTGVINQRQSPSIWQSDSVDFPANYILGRILIDSTTGQIFLDTSNSRLQISNGSNAFVNGLTSYGGIPTNSNIGLGGDMNFETEINVNGQYLNIAGSNTGTTFLSNGAMYDTASEKYYFPVVVEGGAVVIPDSVMTFQDPTNGSQYLVSCRSV
jgi:hypothetical protein